jgi:hypothetical protein
MSAAMNGGFISGFSMGARSDDLVFVPHLFFASDTLIFWGTTPVLILETCHCLF